MTYPLYQVVEGVTLGPLQLPNEVIPAGTTFFQLEAQISSAAPYGIPLKFVQYIAALGLAAGNNLPDVPHMYAVGYPWLTTAAAQQAVNADYNALIAFQTGLINQQILQGPLASNSLISVVGVIATGMGPI